MKRTAKIVKGGADKADALQPFGAKMSKGEKLSLLSEIERIANSEHVALMQKLKRLREAIASDN